MAPKTKKPLKKTIADNAAKGAATNLLQELLHDMYLHRWRIYKLNFVRGISFGFGSVIGGTLMIALLLWILSLFNQLPLLGDFFDTVRSSIEPPK